MLLAAGTLALVTIHLCLQCNWDHETISSVEQALKHLDTDISGVLNYREVLATPGHWPKWVLQRTTSPEHLHAQDTCST